MGPHCFSNSDASQMVSSGASSTSPVRSITHISVVAGADGASPATCRVPSPAVCAALSPTLPPVAERLPPTASDPAPGPVPCRPRSRICVSPAADADVPVASTASLSPPPAVGRGYLAGAAGEVLGCSFFFEDPGGLSLSTRSAKMLFRAGGTSGAAGAAGVASVVAPPPAETAVPASGRDAWGCGLASRSLPFVQPTVSQGGRRLCRHRPPPAHPRQLPGERRRCPRSFLRRQEKSHRRSPSPPAWRSPSLGHSPLPAVTSQNFKLLHVHCIHEHHATITCLNSNLNLERV